MNKRLSVLVSGATGKQGGALARKLIASKHAVYALTRQPSSKAGQELQKLGAQLITADFDDPQSIMKAARGIDAFFLMSTSYEKGPEVEKKQAIDAATAAKTVGIKHLVYTSVASSDLNTGIPHFDSKYQVETYIRSLGVPFTIIAPAYFFENNLSPWSVPSLKNGILQFALPPEKKMQMVACENIGEFAAHVIENRDAFLGSRIELASDELTGPEIAEVISMYAGKRISYERQSIEDVRKMSEDFAKMYTWMIEEGYSIDVTGLRRKYPEIGWLSFSEWAKKQNWQIVS